jgi:hypothetical protein
MATVDELENRVMHTFKNQAEGSVYSYKDEFARFVIRVIFP